MTDRPRKPPNRNGLLFVCAGNGARSQMAEAFARFIGPADIEYFSAGAFAGPDLHAYAFKAMKEVGVDISAHKPKTMDAIPITRIATVISLCALDECPPLPDGVQHLPWPLPDPALADGNDDDQLPHFRRVRDQIRELVSRLF